MSDTFGDFMIGEATKKTQRINELEQELAASQRRLEDCRTVSDRWAKECEQLQARLAAAEALAVRWMNYGTDGSVRQHVATECANQLREAITPPPAPVSGESNE